MHPPERAAAAEGGAGSWLAARLARGYGFGDPRAWRLFLHYFRPHGRTLLGYAIGASLVSMLLLPVVWLVRYAFDHAIPAADVDLLCGIGAAIVAVRLLGTVLSLTLRRTIVGVIKRSVTRLREDLLEHVYLAPRDQMSRADLDRLQTRIVQDTERVDVMGNALLSGRAAGPVLERGAGGDADVVQPRPGAAGAAAAAGGLAGGRVHQPLRVARRAPLPGRVRVVQQGHVVRAAPAGPHPRAGLRGRGDRAAEGRDRRVARRAARGCPGASRCTARCRRP